MIKLWMTNIVQWTIFLPSWIFLFLHNQHQILFLMKPISRLIVDVYLLKIYFLFTFIKLIKNFSYFLFQSCRNSKIISSLLEPIDIPKNVITWLMKFIFCRKTIHFDHLSVVTNIEILKKGGGVNGVDVLKNKRRKRAIFDINMYVI